MQLEVEPTLDQEGSAVGFISREMFRSRRGSIVARAWAVAATTGRSVGGELSRANSGTNVHMQPDQLQKQRTE